MYTLPNRLNEFEYDFANCKLNREQYADILTDVISIYGFNPNGCVISISGEWGSGKTTFIQMWKNKLLRKNCRTLYFNAWECDFVDDPLIALLGELKELAPNSSNFDTLLSKAGRIVSSAIPGFIQAAIKTIIPIDFNQSSQIVKDVANEASRMSIEQFMNYQEKKATLSQFKDTLSRFVADCANPVSGYDKYPVVFFIDELDRCSPTFAVKLLERLKHLFDISGIVFVLAINRKQLEKAICGYFNCPKMDASEYLQRFIDRDFSLPNPKDESMECFCSTIYDYYDFNSFFVKRRKSYEDRDECNSFREVATVICESCHLPLRTIDKIYSSARIALNSFGPGRILLPDVFFILCFLRIVHRDLYDQIHFKQLSIQSLYSSLEDIFSEKLQNTELSKQDSKCRHLLWCIANLITHYNNSELTSQRLDSDFYNHSQDRAHPDFPLECSPANKEVLFEALACYSERSDYISLAYFIDRIELLYSISNE